MHTTPATAISSGSANRRNGKLPCSAAPARVTVTGSSPTINDTGATPARCTPPATHR